MNSNISTKLLKTFVLISWAFILVFSGCTKKETNLNPTLPIVTAKFDPASLEKNKKKETPKYIYPGFKFRDPFIPLNSSDFSMRSSNEVIIPNIDSLTLKGILDEKNKRMALLTGGGISYILQDNKLYDNRRRHVPGISGTVTRDSAILIDSNNKTIELKIKTNK